MREAIVEDNHLTIPELYEFIPVYHPALDDKIKVALARDFVTQYDL